MEEPDFSDLKLKGIVKPTKAVWKCLSHHNDKKLNIKKESQWADKTNFRLLGVTGDYISFISNGLNRVW
jgi:hypothetical protein